MLDDVEKKLASLLEAAKSKTLSATAAAATVDLLTGIFFSPSI